MSKSSTVLLVCLTFQADAVHNVFSKHCSSPYFWPGWIQQSRSALQTTDSSEAVFLIGIKCIRLIYVLLYISPAVIMQLA
jgi:hypothetical protein